MSSPIPTGPFDELAWVNRYIGREHDPISRDDVEIVLNFTLIWNMFESLVCGQNASVPEMQTKVNDLYCKGVLTGSSLAPFLAYFQDRYVENGDVNHRFGDLNFRRNDRQELVTSVLKGTLSDENNVALALLIIVYRFRNNLFHGMKSVYTLNYQTENFRTANRLLAYFLELLKQEASPG